MNQRRFHVSVNNIEQSTRFYSAVFDAEPAAIHADYVRWSLNDPAVEFVISKRDATSRGFRDL